MGGAWLSTGTHRQSSRVFNALLWYLDARLLVGDLVDFATASMAQATRSLALATDVRTIRILLCRLACVDLGLVGSKFRVDSHVVRHLEKAVHSGGRRRIFNDELVGCDFDPWLDATSWQTLAVFAPIHLLDRCIGDPALLVA